MLKKQYRLSERGNVLFLILIATALFGALSFTVSKMLRSGNTNKISRDSARLYANEILDYTRSVHLAIKDMRISNGCSDAEISFENSTVSGYINAQAPSDKRCHVFDINGGGMTYIVPQDDWLQASFLASTLYKEWYFTGHTCIENVGGSETNCHTDGIDNSDLMLYLPYVREDVCLEVNNSLGIGVDNNNAWDPAETKFTGSYGETGTRNEGGLSAFPTACFQTLGTSPSRASYTIYKVLIPR